MKLAVIGATGFVGSQVVQELRSRGHTVTAIARDTAKVPADRQVEAVSVDIHEVDRLAEALKGHDVVINAFNPGWSDPQLYEHFLEGSRDIQAAVKQAGVQRFITIGGAGSLFADGQQLVDGPDFPAEFKPGALAARDYLAEIQKETDLDWVFISPAIEMNQTTAGTRRGTYRLGKDEPVMDENGRSLLSVEDLAVVIADEAEQAAHHRERFTAAY